MAMAVTESLARINSSMTRAELRGLVESTAGPSISVYMPTVRSGRDVQSNAPHFRNLLRDAAEQLEAIDVEHSVQRSLKRDLNDLMAGIDHSFLRSPSDGLAFFMSPEFSRSFALPVPFREKVLVNQRFLVSPLLEYFQSNGRFYVLAVSQNDVRLLEGNKHRLAEVDVAGLPHTLVEALNIDEYVQSLQFHMGARGGDRRGLDHGAGMFHGHAGGDQGDRKQDIVEFFRRLDDALVHYFHDETAPLVFAGVDYLFPIYQESNHYRWLADQAVVGNPERLSAADLHGPAWQIVEPLFDAARREAIEQFGALRAHRQGSDDLREVIDAATIGRVGTLLVERGAMRPGLVNHASGAIKPIESDEQPGAENLLDHAATQCILNSGTVYLLDPEEMPTPAPIAALYRY
jgi:hypothetical protein